MKIIFNSDILYHTYPITDNLPPSLLKIITTCAERGYTIVIPQTSLYEFNRKQSEFVRERINELQKAYAILRKHKIAFKEINPADIIKEPDLLDLIERYQAEVVLEEPTIEDYKEAHRRACLHEAPHPPDTKSDEMRDLVIWMIALRLSQQDKEALLVSRDILHTHSRGDEEAGRAGLVRVKSIEEALDYFEVKTPAGNLIERLLLPVWPDMVKAGIPVNEQMAITAVSKSKFIQGAKGPAFASSIFKAKTSDGKIFQATIEIIITNGVIDKVMLSNITVDNNPWEKPKMEIIPNKSWEIEDGNYMDRFEALQDIIRS